VAWPLSALAQDTLARSHAVTIRATVATAAGGIATDLPISGGSVTLDATSQVRGQATVTIADPTLWPAAPTDILSPLGSEMLLEYGIACPGSGIEWVPLGVFVLSEADRTRPVTSGGAITLSLVDRSQKVADDRFDAPVQVGGTGTYGAAITALIQQTLPTVTVTDTTNNTTTAASLDIQRERWADGVEAMATAIAAECYADRQGNFVLRPQPTLDDAPAWSISSGQAGVLITKQEKATRELVYNRVVATGSRSDGTAPVWAGVSDTDPASPTVYGGSFGRKPRFYSSPLLTTVDQCTAAAAALLARVTGMQASVALTMVVNPAIDPGDVLVVHDAGTVTALIVDKVTIPLAATDAQQIQTRSLDLPAES
jgi:hypothetical protein